MKPLFRTSLIASLIVNLVQFLLFERLLAIVFAFPCSSSGIYPNASCVAFWTAILHAFVLPYLFFVYSIAFFMAFSSSAVYTVLYF